MTPSRARNTWKDKALVPEGFFRGSEAAAGGWARNVALFMPQMRSAPVNREGSCSARSKNGLATEAQRHREHKEEKQGRVSCVFLCASVLSVAHLCSARSALPNLT